MNIGMRQNGSPFFLPDTDQGQHIFVDGGTGTGKSVLLSNMAAPLLARGEGLCVIDPHGSLADDIIRQIGFEAPADLNAPLAVLCGDHQQQAVAARL